MYRVARLFILVHLAWVTAPGVAAPQPEPMAKSGVDAFGDALPDGALMRFGSNRLSHGQPVTGLVFSPDSKLLASIAPDMRLRIWHAESGRQMTSVPIPNTFGVAALGFSPDSTLIALSNRASFLTVIEVSSGRTLWSENNQSAQGLA